MQNLQHEMKTAYRSIWSRIRHLLDCLHSCKSMEPEADFRADRSSAVIGKPDLKIILGHGRLQWLDSLQPERDGGWGVRLQERERSVQSQSPKINSKPCGFGLRFCSTWWVGLHKRQNQWILHMWDKIVWRMYRVSFLDKDIGCISPYNLGHPIIKRKRKRMFSKFA